MTSNSDSSDPKASPEVEDDEATTRTLRKPPIVPKTAAWDSTKTLGEADFFVDGSHVKEQLNEVSPSAPTSLVPPIVEESQSDKTQVHHMDISLSDFQDEAPADNNYERFDTGPFESLSLDEDVVEHTEPQAALKAKSPAADFPIHATPSSTTFPKPKAPAQSAVAPLPERSPGASRIHDDPPLVGGLTGAANSWKVVPTEWGESGPPPKVEPPKESLPSNLRSVKTALWSRPPDEENDLDETQRSVLPDFPAPVPEAMPTPSHSTPARAPTVALASTTYILDAIEFLESIDVSGLPPEPQLSAKSKIAGALGKLKRALDLLQRN